MAELIENQVFLKWLSRFLLIGLSVSLLFLPILIMFFLVSGFNNSLRLFEFVFICLRIIVAAVDNFEIGEKS